MTVRIAIDSNGLKYITNEPVINSTYENEAKSAYQRGYLDGMAKRPQPLTDEQIMNIVDAQRAKVSSDTARVGYRVARAIEKAHDITGEQR